MMKLDLESVAYLLGAGYSMVEIESLRGVKVELDDMPPVEMDVTEVEDIPYVDGVMEGNEGDGLINDGVDENKGDDEGDEAGKVEGKANDDGVGEDDGEGDGDVEDEGEGDGEDDAVDMEEMILMMNGMYHLEGQENPQKGSSYKS
ncbi:histone chaperone cia1 [Lactuca sativa]|nr:histone chaperone cia1 [Lactuca sativa]